MSTTATINSITLNLDNAGNPYYDVNVTFADSGTGFTSTKDYSFLTSITILEVKTQIQQDGAMLKTACAASTALQSSVGTVIAL